MGRCRMACRFFNPYEQVPKAQTSVQHHCHFCMFAAWSQNTCTVVHHRGLGMQDGCEVSRLYQCMRMVPHTKSYLRFVCRAGTHEHGERSYSSTSVVVVYPPQKSGLAIVMGMLCVITHVCQILTSLLGLTPVGSRSNMVKVS
jgi:hypothetical protein